MEKTILGIIAEYNPLHKGHAYHLDQAKKACNADLTIVCMSGPFTQRGDGAIFSPAARAEMAIYAGADLVFELPTLFAVREADVFALGGVALLTQLGCTHLSFGCETADLALFERANELINAPTLAFSEQLHKALDSGCSYASAQGRALEKCLNTRVLSKPNNVLGLCYLKAIAQLNSPLIPLPITRLGSYHDIASPSETALPSATALRGAIQRGDWVSSKAMTPTNVYPVIQREMAQGRIFHPTSLDQALRLTLLNASPAFLQALPGATEGLDQLLKKHSEAFLSKEHLLVLIKSKRYTYTRLNRLLAHLLIDITKESLIPLPTYIRLLAARKQAVPYLRSIKKSGFPVIEKAAKFNRDDPCFKTDIRAYDLWALGAGLPMGLGFRQSPWVEDYSTLP